jgi:hypothetical protein
MKSRIKTLVIAGMLSIGAYATLIPTQAHAAPNNGGGIVFHRSDCSAYNVRFYGGGGRYSGSTCGYWISELERTIIWAQDWNWSYCDLARVRGTLQSWSDKGITPTSGSNQSSNTQYVNFFPIVWALQDSVGSAIGQTGKCGY